MKHIAILSLFAVGSLVGGEEAPVWEKSPIAPPPAPTLYQWFAGLSAGYLIDNEEVMYTGHIGLDLNGQLGGWDTALYLEIGYAELDGCLLSNSYRNGSGNGYGNDITGKGYETSYDLGSLLSEYGKINMDMEIIPLTLNYKLERPIGAATNVYVGVGAGVAFIDVSASVDGMSDSDDDTVFFGQLFGGVVHNVSPSFEVFAGARLIYFDEPDFNLFNTSVDLGDLNSVGFDAEDTDVMVEIGGRLNF